MAHQERFQLQGHAPEMYERYNVPSTFRPLAQLFLEHVGLWTGEQVLDVACGTGIIARLAVPQVGPSGQVVGVDLNPGMLEVARAQSAGAGVPVEWRQGDTRALPFAPATFDVVLCQQSLQFFPDKVIALREMRRVLVSDGRLGLEVWEEKASDDALYRPHAGHDRQAEVWHGPDMPHASRGACPVVKWCMTRCHGIRRGLASRLNAPQRQGCSPAQNIQVLPSRLPRSGMGLSS